jgi:hypothetical protein
MRTQDSTSRESGKQQGTNRNTLRDFLIELVERRRQRSSYSQSIWGNGVREGFAG